MFFGIWVYFPGPAYWQHITYVYDYNWDGIITFNPRLPLFISHSSRPDVFYSIIQLYQVSNKATTLENTKLLNDSVLYLKETKNLKLRYGKLKKINIQLYFFVESRYNTYIDHTSQLKMIIVIMYNTHTCHFIHWSSLECQSCTSSMLSSETHAFSNGFYYVISLKFKSMNINILSFFYGFKNQFWYHHCIKETQGTTTY